MMMIRNMSLPRLAVIGATRGLLGMGAGLLASKRMSNKRRTNLGRALVALGVISTVPLAMSIFSSIRAAAESPDGGAMPSAEPEGVPAHV